MKNPQTQDPRKRHLKFILPVILIIISSVIIAFFYKKYLENNHFRVIKFTGVTEIANISKFELIPDSRMAQDSACYVLAENKDLLYLDSITYQVTEFTEDSIHVDIKPDTAVYINDKLYSLIINDKANLVPFLKSLTQEDMKSLSSLHIECVLPEGYLPFLKNISKVNRDVSLYVVDDSASTIFKDYLRRANYFNPRILSALVYDSLYSNLAAFTNINTLFIAIPDALLKPLPKLPKLKKCILITDTINNSWVLLNHNPHAKLLPLVDVAFLSSGKNFKTVPSIEIPGSENTSTLYVSLHSSGITHDLEKFTKVKWLIMDGDFSAADFEKALQNFQKVQILEIRGNETLTDYKCLGSLHNLRGLIIKNTGNDLKTLPKLEHLKYLSIPEGIYSDSMKANYFLKTYPGCIIAPNGACLGSGWLLLIPILSILAFTFINAKKRIKG